LAHWRSCFCGSPIPGRSSRGKARGADGSVALVSGYFAISASRADGIDRCR
jgi:hypothetical protein